jgi:hypothetical protein
LKTRLRNGRKALLDRKVISASCVPSHDNAPCTFVCATTDQVRRVKG